MSIAGSSSPPPTNERRRRVLVPSLVTLGVLIAVGALFMTVYTERLWYNSVDYGSVYTTMILTRVGLFAVFGAVFALIVGVNLYLAYRFRPAITSNRPSDPAVRYRAALVPNIRLIFPGVLIAVFLIAGGVAQGRWEQYLMWRNGTDFGQTDPYFGRDVGFYVFDYPWLRLLTSFGFSALVVTGLLVIFLYYVFGSIQVAGRGASFTRAAQVHVAVLFGLGMLVQAFSYYLNRFGFILGSDGLLQGITYTDDNARIPATNILIGVAIVCALLFFAVIVVRSWVLPAIGLGLLIVTAILIRGVWPMAMQAFQVDPSEPDREAPYIAHNIDATRDAFDVADVDLVDYDGETEMEPEELAATAEENVSSRLIDPTLVSPAFQQLQQVRGYYTMPETLDVGRYRTDEDTNIPQDVIIAARELNLDGLQEGQRNWANDHTVYTHGYGVVAARGNERGAQGEPVWEVRDIPPQSDHDVFEFAEPPRIYFGENSPEYSIVGREEGDAPIEVDIPRGGGQGADPEEIEEGDADIPPEEGDAADGDVTQNTYDGEGGVPIGSAFRQVLYAMKFGEPNIILSNRVNAESRILYDRHPRQRVEKVAPWLTVDGDPFPAVVDGRLVWILDGYTTSNAYPYSESRSLRDATSDTLTQGEAQIALPQDNINYMRNSVKAVVDAYDGTVDLYKWDDDPIMEAWDSAFGDVLQDRDEIPEALMEHLRYPVDMFKVQRDVLTRYHVTDEQTFYEGGERWVVPTDPTEGENASSLQPPFYLTITRPEEENPAFALTSVYLPIGRENLASFVSVNSEATDENYGQLQVLQLPSDSAVLGPGQTAARFSAEPMVQEALLPFTRLDANVLQGNLLTLPVGDGLMYVQPVYIQRTGGQGAYPVLQFVVVSFGEQIGFGRDLDEAVRVALGLQEADDVEVDPEELPDGEGDGEPMPDPEPTPEPEPEPDPTPTEEAPDLGDLSLEELSQSISENYEAAQTALEGGDLGEYQARIDEMYDQMGELLNRLQDE